MTSALLLATARSAHAKASRKDNDRGARGCFDDVRNACSMASSNGEESYGTGVEVEVIGEAQDTDFFDDEVEGMVRKLDA